MNPPAWIGLASLFLLLSIQGLGFAYWAGRLSQRVLTLEKTGEGEAGLNDKVIRLEVEMQVANRTLESMDRHIQGVNRQLANIATGSLHTRAGSEA